MPDTPQRLSFKIDGADVTDDVSDSLVEVTVDTSLYLPDMFTIYINDVDGTFVDDSKYDLGKEIEILAGSASLFKGEITAVEPNFSQGGKITLLLQGYDKSHRLHRGRKTRTFLKRKDSDVVQDIAGEAGLSPATDATSTTYDYLLQNNQTNMEFLLERARRLGYQVYVSQGKLNFVKSDVSQGKTAELTWNQELLSFRPRLTASHQVDKVIVRGWDPGQKQPIKGEASPNGKLKQGGYGKTGGDAAKSAFSTATEVVVNYPVVDAMEAEAMAKGLSDNLSGEFVQAEGVCFGNPDVQAGAKVKIQGVGKRFSGEYFVTSARHVYRRGRYETIFSISGRQPNTLSHLLENGNGHESREGRIYGVVPAIVTNVQDKEGQGRIKVKYPWLWDTKKNVEIESDWVRIAAPSAGGKRGIYWLPEVEDEVLVAFEHGDPNRPYMLGALWNGKDNPPKPNKAVLENGKVKERIIHSRSGHVIILDDSNGNEKIIVRDKNEKNEIVISSKDNSITIRADGNISIESGKDISIDAKGKITMKSGSDMTLNSQAKSTFKAMASMALDAQKITIGAKTQLEMEGKAQSTLKGAQVGIQGQAMTEVKAGGPVKVQGAVIMLN